MQAIWKGTISFGLVSIPVALYPAVRKEEIKLRMVRKRDLSPINYRRIAEADGQEVPYEETVKAYEYEKGAFVPLTDEDFSRARTEGVQNIQIIDFVAEEEIDPLYYDKAYFLQPERGGARAYTLLREAMVETKTVGIGKVVIRSRQHLAALKPKGKLLMMELMHFADDLVSTEHFQAPVEASANRKEMDLAKALIGSMVTKWDPRKYHDDYRSALLQIVEEKMKAGHKAGARRGPPAKVPGNVLDVMEMLERSLKGVVQKPASRAKSRKQRAAA